MRSRFFCFRGCEFGSLDRASLLALAWTAGQSAFGSYLHDVPPTHEVVLLETLPPLYPIASYRSYHDCQYLFVPRTGQPSSDQQSF